MDRKPMKRTPRVVGAALAAMGLLSAVQALADEPRQRYTMYGEVTTVVEADTPAWVQTVEDFGGPDLVFGQVLLLAVALAVSFVGTPALRTIGRTIVTGWCALQCLLLSIAAIDTGYWGSQLAALMAAAATTAALASTGIWAQPRRRARPARAEANLAPAALRGSAAVAG